MLQALVKSPAQARLPTVEMPTLPEHDLKVDRTGDKITQYVGTPTPSGLRYGYMIPNNWIQQLHLVQIQLLHQALRHRLLRHRGVAIRAS